MLRHKHWYDVRAAGKKVDKLFRATCMTDPFFPSWQSFEALKSHVMIRTRREGQIDSLTDSGCTLSTDKQSPIKQCLPTQDDLYVTSQNRPLNVIGSTDCADGQG